MPAAGGTRARTRPLRRISEEEFNFLAKRIVQLQDADSEIRRKGRVRVLRNNQPTDRVHRYELPEDWSLVPSRATP